MKPDFVIFFDGGYKSPDLIAVGAVVCSAEGEHITESARWMGTGTSNEAEYKGLLHAIAMANFVGARQPLFCSDSKLIVKQVNRKWAVKGHLCFLHGRCTGLLMEFDRWLLSHVPREKNKRADWIVSTKLGHARATKKPPPIDLIELDEHEGWAGWSELAKA